MSTSFASLVAALAAGHWLTTTFETGGSSDGSFVRTGAVGDLVQLEYADVRVRDVRPARRLLGSLSSSTPTQAAGVYVVVSVELTATRDRSSDDETVVVGVGPADLALLEQVPHQEVVPQLVVRCCLDGRRAVKSN